MIKTLRLKNFRGIQEGEINFGPMTILLGSNNSGKTTILESLFLAPNPLRKTVYAPYISSRGRRERTPYLGAPAIMVFHSLHETLESKGYAILFNNYSAKSAIIDVDFDNKNNKLNFYRYQNNIYLDSNLAPQRDTLNLPDRTMGYFARLSEYDIMEFGGSTEIILMDDTFLVSSSLIKSGFTYMAENWANIMNLGIARKVVDQASDFSSENYVDITLEPFFRQELSLNAYLDDGRRIRLGDLGEGIQNFITAKILYSIEEAKLLLWDDIEAHLNPRILLNIANWFMDLIDKNKQIIITTHSKEVVNIFAGLIEETMIYLTNLEDNKLKCKMMNFNEFDSLINKGIDPRLSERFLL